MGLQVECPDVDTEILRERLSVRGSFDTVSRRGRGEFSRLTKTSGKIYWIEYRITEAEAERIGPSKAAAESRLLEVQKGSG